MTTAASAPPPDSAGAESVSVGLLAVAETTPGALHGLYEVLGAVGVAWQAATGEPTTSRRMNPRIVTRHAAPFRSVVGPLIAPDTTLDDAAPWDVVIVPDVELSAVADVGAAWQPETGWLQRQAAAGALVCSVCSGAVVLAEAGLLDGMEATTHWSTVTLFRDRYPTVLLRPERILCPAGRGHCLITAGGSSSWGDLALYLIARFSGDAEAVRIAKLFLLGDRGEGQLPFAAMARPRQHADAVIGDCQAWLADHYAAANPVARMVERSGLPERTFKRRFKAATGYRPVDYVQALRVEEAKHLLETTRTAVDAIARAVGYEDAAFFRRLFKRCTGTTPARYRTRYQTLIPASSRAARMGSSCRA
jgi:transcriptional regulator GlxA family with amidase domain